MLQLVAHCDSETDVYRADLPSLDLPGLPLSGDSALRLHGGAADDPLVAWLLSDCPDEVQSGASTLPQPGSPAATSAATTTAPNEESEGFRWRCLDSTHLSVCVK